jgi:hypothetical protein
MENVKEQQVKAQELSQDDLKSIAAIIDVVTKRGAIQASEMAGVGVIFNKVTSLIKVEEEETLEKAD